MPTSLWPVGRSVDSRAGLFLILEFHILQEVVLEALEPDHRLDTRDRGVIIQYFNEMVRVAAGEFARVQQTLQTYAAGLALTDRSKDEFLAMLGHELRNPLGLGGRLKTGN